MKTFEISDYEPDSARAEGSSIADEPGSAEPLCARSKGATREVSLREKLISDHGLYFLRGPTRSGERARFVGRFIGIHGALNGWLLASAPA